MTYPPQPGQPDPYGQQPQQGGWDPNQPQQPYPQQGGWDPNQQQQQQPYPTQQYPQQGGWDQTQQYPQQGWDPNQQQQQWGQAQGWDQNAGYGQGFGGPPALPKKGKTGLIIGIVALVVVLGAVAVTGFIAPGFFLSKDSSDTASGPDKTAQDIVDALNRKDKAALNGLKCANAEEDIAQIIDNVDKVSDVKLNGPATKVTETEYTANVSMKINGNPSTRKGTISKAGDKWCWKEVGATGSPGKTSTPRTTDSEPPTEPTSKPGTGEASGPAADVAKAFLDKLNGGDTQGAIAMACSDEKQNLTTWLQSILKPPYALKLGNVSGTSIVSADVSGTASGKPADGLMFMKNESGAGFCISTFFVTAQ